MKLKHSSEILRLSFLLNLRINLLFQFDLKNSCKAS